MKSGWEGFVDFFQDHIWVKVFDDFHLGALGEALYFLEVEHGEALDDLVAIIKWKNYLMHILRG